MNAESGQAKPRSRSNLRAARGLSFTSSLATAALALLGLVTDLIPVAVRLAIVAIIFVLAIVGFWANRTLRRDAETSTEEAELLAEQLDQARGTVDSSSPGRALDAIALALFTGSGAWRLSLYAVEQADNGDWWLRRIVRRSASEIYEKSGRHRIPLTQSLLREITTMNLTDPTNPYSNQSGALPDRNIEPEEWKRLQLHVMGDETAVGGLGMPTRKYAWCATREQETRKTVALVAESVDPDGIKFDVFRSPLVAPWLAMTATLVEMAPQILPHMTQAADALHVNTRSRDHPNLG